jgi:hypothetical protein
LQFVSSLAERESSTKTLATGEFKRLSAAFSGLYFFQRIPLIGQ